MSLLNDCDLGAPAVPTEESMGDGTSYEDPPEERAAIIAADFPEADGPKRCDDMANAERLVSQHGRDLAYCEKLGGWCAWRGNRWLPEACGAAVEAWKATAATIEAEADLADSDEERQALRKHAHASRSAKATKAALWLAQSAPGIETRPEEFDRDEWLLNVANGTIDLRTGTLRKHRREDRITALLATHYLPHAPAPTWERFLNTVIPEAEEREYLQRWAGYCLTGSTKEQCLLFLEGTGANGKSTFLETMRRLLGPSYAETGHEDTLLQKGGNARADAGELAQVAKLKGKRLVVYPDLGNATIKATHIKVLTSEDAITAKHLHGQPFTFQPSAKVVISANHRPPTNDMGFGLFRRLHMLPFRVTIAEHQKDKDLPAKLAREFPGILRWAVEGCLSWQRMGGLIPPPSVAATVDAYRDENDTFGRFAAEKLEFGADYKVSRKSLRRVYETWCKEEGEPEWQAKRVASALRERGCTDRKVKLDGSVTDGWAGVRLRPEYAGDFRED